MKAKKRKKSRIGFIDILLFSLLFFCIFGQRLVLPVAGQTPAVFPLVMVTMLIMVLTKKFTLHIGRLILFSLFMMIAYLPVLFNSSFSMTSYVYVFLLYIPFLIKFEIQEEWKIKYLKKFQSAVLFTAFFGIVQFVLQAAGMEFFDPMSFINPEFIQTGYNTTYPIAYDSPISKPNGGFYLEPSMFSQFLALGIIVELIFFKRWNRVFVFFIAILLSFSGTGLLLLAVFSIPLLLRLKLKHLVLILGIASIAGYFFFTSEFGELTTGRTQEYKSQSSSFSIRITNPFLAVFQSDENELLLGHGAGQSTTDHFPFDTNFTVIPKLWYEYGLFSTLIFMIFLFSSVFAKNRNILISALFFMYLFLSGSLLQPQTVFLMYFIINIANIKKVEELKFTKKKHNILRSKIALTKTFKLKIVKKREVTPN